MLLEHLGVGLLFISSTMLIEEESPIWRSRWKARDKLMNSLEPSMASSVPKIPFFNHYFGIRISTSSFLRLFIGRLQTHFENVQRISDTTTLPYAMHYLRSRILEELDVSHLTGKLMQGKGQSNAITTKEKLELWERLKVTSMSSLMYLNLF